MGCRCFPSRRAALRRQYRRYRMPLMTASAPPISPRAVRSQRTHRRRLPSRRVALNCPPRRPSRGMTSHPTQRLTRSRRLHRGRLRLCRAALRHCRRHRGSTLLKRTLQSLQLDRKAMSRPHLTRRSTTTGAARRRCTLRLRASVHSMTWSTRRALVTTRKDGCRALPPRATSDPGEFSVVFSAARN